MNADAYVDHTPVEVNHPGLQGKSAVVTGGARGMGAVFADGLARAGVNVLASDLDALELKQQVESTNAVLVSKSGAGSILGQQMDVVDPDAHDELAARAVSEFGRLDFWVNNAGIFPEASLPYVPASQFRQALSVNVEGVMYGTQAAARVMEPGSAIVNMASVAAVRVRRGRSAYCASKAAVEHLTHCQAVELGDRGIRVNAIAPGFIDTAMTRWVHDQPGKLEEVLSSVPLHRIGSPQEVLGVLLFLLSDSARYVTGHTLAVDGGSRFV